MINSTQRTITALVISLVIQVISLTGLAFAAPAPVVTNQPAFTDGVIAPVRMAIDGQTPSNYYVADPRASGILKLNGQQRLVGIIRTAKAPKGVAVGKLGNTAGKVLVSQGNYVAAYNDNGTEALRLGAGVGEFADADGIAVDDSGFIYVVDSKAKAVKIYNQNGGYTGNTLTTWTPPAQTPAIPTAFTFPTGIAYDTAGGRIAVVDTMGSRVYFFNTTGGMPTYSTFIGYPAPQDGGGDLYYTMPTGVAFEYSAGVLNRVYILDAFQGNVQVVDPAGAYNNTTGQGTFLSRIGSYGLRAGQLTSPTDVVFDNARKLVVVSNSNSNLVTYGIDGGVVDVPISCPGLTLDPPPASNPDGTVTVGGTYSNTTSIVVSATSPAVAGTVTMNAGVWSCTISGLTPGSNSFVVRAYNAGTCVTTVNGSVQHVGIGALTINPHAPTNVSPILVTGTVTEGATVSVHNDANNADYPATVAGTTWSAVVTVVEGNNHLIATATKPNYTFVPAPTDVLMDTVSPVLSVSAISGGSSTSTQIQNVTGQASDAAGSVAVTVNGQAADVVNGVFSAPVVLVAGSNAITVEATDVAGNRTLNMRYVDFDFAPTRPVVATTLGEGTVTILSSISLSGTSANADFLTVAGQPVSLEPTGNWNTTVSGLLDGLNTIEIVASNLNGMTSTIKRTVTKNMAGPALTLNLPVQDVATNIPVVTLSGTTTASGATLTSTFDGGAPVTRTISGGAFSFDLNIPREASFPVLLTLTEGANTTTLVRNVIYDNTPPNLKVDPNSSSALIFGTADFGAATAGTAKVQVLDNGTTPIGNVTENEDGSWSADMAGVTYDIATAIVKATDPAGNSVSMPAKGAAIMDGDFDGDKVVTVRDALVCLRVVVYDITPTFSELAHGDVGPLVGGALSPDGSITLPDCMIILQEATGLTTPLNPVQP